MKKLFLLSIILAFISCSQSNKTTNIDLSGEWKFALDPDDKGIIEEWYKKQLSESIKLPGSLQEQGYGYDVDTTTQWTGQVVDKSWYTSPFYAEYRKPGNVKVPFWLNPVKHYVGVAWYQKDINIPTDWKNKSIFVNLERTHWETTVFIDGEKIGTQNALSTLHSYELKDIKEGKHTLSIRVDNRLVIPVGINAHSVSDHTQSNWNGITGAITIEAKPLVHIDNLKIFPDVKNKQIKVIAQIANNTNTQQLGKIELLAITINPAQNSKSENKIENVELKPGINLHEVIVKMGDNPLLWSEYTPNVYQLNAKLESNNDKSETTSNFGMREFGKDGRRFTINGTPIFLRGTLECCIFPLTGYPATDEAYWEKIYTAVKNHGLNHVRFHSWCPPKAAFDVADREGIYLQVECAAWTEVGTGNLFDKWVYEEGDRILREYGNHPSFFALLYSNEPGGNSAPFLTDLNNYWHKVDGRHMYSSAGGWPYIEAADFYNSPDPRIQHWGAGLNSIINKKAPETTFDFREMIQRTHMPTVSHEIGQWCVYPNFKEIEKYTGVLKAKNFEIFRDRLNDNHLGDLSNEFLMASGRLQTLCYKADIEAALRTPEFAGFQLLDLHDFPGQGSALIGVLDAFWEEKGYVSPEEYRTFCNKTVPLARMEKLVWKSNETFKANIEISHFDEKELNNASIEWNITDASENVLKTGNFKNNLPITNCIEVGVVEFNLNSIDKASQLLSNVNIPNANAKNSWNIWVYPDIQITDDDIYITDKLDDKTKTILNNGGKVLLALKRNSIKEDKGGDVKVGFSSIFWNTAWTSKNQPPFELGIYCDPKNPALEKFPTSYHSDYQWWEIVSNADAMSLSDFPADFRPIVHIIDDWFTSRKLGLVFEAKIGNGKILVTSADLYTDIENRTAAKQFKYSLIEYMKTDAFNPATNIELELIQSILK